jgi:membrane protein DedA with SNARE-associated domain
MGHWSAGKFLKKGSPRQRCASKAAVLLERNPNLIIFSYRFFYGFRTAIPLLIGATGCSFRRFILLSSTGAAVWSITVTAAGLVCGKALLLFMTDMKSYRLWCVGGLGIIGVVLWVIYHLKHRPSD